MKLSINYQTRTRRNINTPVITVVYRLIRRDRGSKFKVRNSNRLLLRWAILQDANPQCFGVVHLTKLLPSFKI